MSTRIKPQHPAEKQKHDKSHKKMPTSDKEWKLMNRIKELGDKKQQIASSIVSRGQFLHNTMINNKKNEVQRLAGVLTDGPMSYANDGRFLREQLTPQQRASLLQRGMKLTNDIKTMTPLIGKQSRFMYA